MANDFAFRKGRKDDVFHAVKLEDGNHLHKSTGKVGGMSPFAAPLGPGSLYDNPKVAEKALVKSGLKGKLVKYRIVPHEDD